MEPESPLFSIVVPTYARPKPLAACLDALARLDYPRDRFEVIVVDDGSPAPPKALVASFRDRLNVTLLTPRHAGPAAARNTGAAHARGRVLAFTDDDCMPEPDWLQRLDAAFQESPNCMIGGRTVNRLTANPYSTASQVIVDAVYAFYNQDATAPRFFASNNVAMPVRIFRALGGFDETFPLAASEDRELCDRWRFRGYRMLYLPAAVVQHAHPLTLRRFCKQHFNYGRGAFRYHQIRARRGSGRMSQDLRFHAELFHLLRPPLAELPARRLPAALVLLLVWQFVNALGFFYEKYQAARAESRPVPATNTPA
jgi:GT2 family glycosyltransferase